MASTNATTNFTVTVQAELDTSQIDKTLKSKNYSVKVSDDGVSSTAKSVQDLDSATQSATQSASDLELTYNVANQIFNKTVEVIESLVEQVYELDDAITEFKKVSDLTGSALDSYVSKLGDVGSAYGRTASEMTQAASLFRKSGFNDQDAASLAAVAAEYQNIADTEVSADDAASTIVSQLRAFGLEAEDATHIVDAYNEVANRFSVGTNDISNAMEIASAGMATYGNSFEEIIGLVTSGTELMVGRGQQVARGLNTIAANIVANQDVLKEYGITVEDANGDLKSTYDVLSELKPVWDNLAEAERTELGITLAGKNQYKVLASVMSNFSQAVNATNTALDSAGSAEAENTKYMESLEAQTNNLKASFQTLANDVIDKELVSSILNLTNGLVELADTGLGQVLSKVLLLGGVSWGATSLLKVTNIVPTVISQFASFGRIINTTSAGVKAGIPLFESLEVGLAGAGGAAGTFAGVLSASLPTLLAISAAVVLVVEAVKAIKQAYDDAHPSLEDYKQAAEEANQAYADMNAEGGELDTLKEKADKLTEAEQNRLTILQAQSDELKLQAELKDKDYYKSFVESRESDYQATKTAIGTQVGVGEVEYAEAYTTTQSRESLLQLQSAIQGVTEAYGRGKISQSSYLAKLQDLVDANSEDVDVLKAAKEAGIELNDQDTKLISVYDGLVTKVDEVATAINNSTNAQNENGDSAEENAEYISNYVDQLINEAKYAGTAKDKIYDLVAQEIILNKQGLDLSQQIAALDQLATSAGVASTYVSYAIAASQGMNTIKAGSSEYTYDASRGGYFKYSGGTQTRITAEEYQSAQNEYLSDLWGHLSSQITTSSTGSGGGSSSSSTTDTKLTALKEAVTLLQQQLTLAQHQNKSVEEQNAIRKQIQDALHAEAEYMRSIGSDESDIVALSNQWYDIQDDIAESLEVSADALQEALEAYKDSLSETDDLSDKLEEIEEDRADIIEKENDLIEAQNDLLDARNERTLRVYNAATGQFEWTADPSSVSQAEEAVEDANDALVEAQEELANDQAEYEKLVIEDAVDDLISSLGTTREQILKSLNNLIANGMTPELQSILKNNADYFAQFKIDIEAILANMGVDVPQTEDYYYSGNVTTSVQSGSNRGDAPTGTQVGDVVVTNGGTYLVVPEGTEGANYNPSSGLYSVKISDETIASSGVTTKTSSSSSSSNSSSSSTTKTSSGGSSKLSEGGAGGYGIGSISKKANGTLSADEGISLVGEEGAELRVLNQGDGIIPHNVTKNLWAFGKDPASYIKNLSSNNSIGTQYNLGNITLSEAQAKSMTVYDLARMSRTLAVKSKS